MAGRKRLGVYRHGNGGWKIQVKNPKTGRWKQLAATRKRFDALGIPLRNGTTVTKSDAYRLKLKYEEHLARGSSATLERTNLQVAIQEYLRYQRNSAKFLRDKKRVLGEFAELVGETQLPDITREHLRNFEDYLGDVALRLEANETARKLHANTVIRYLKYVRSFFNFCYREGWIFRSPFINFPLPQERAAPIRPYSLKDVREVVSFLRDDQHNDREYAVWMVAGFVGLGLRSIELHGLNWEDFDPEQRFARISESKNLESRRPQPVPLSIMPLLCERQRESGPMFPAQAGQRASPNQMNSLAKRIANKFPGFIWARFRKTYSTLLQNAGVDSLIIDRLLGHSSRSSAIRVSAQFYIGREYEFYRSLVDEALEPLTPLFATG